MASPDPNPVFRLEYSDVRFWYPWHFHAEVEIKQIVAGSGTRMVGDSIEPFSEGDLCLIGAETPHCWSSRAVRGRWVRARVVQFLPSLFGELPVGAILERARCGLQITGPAAKEAGAELERLLAARTTTRQLGHLLAFLGIVAEAEQVRALSSAPLQSARPSPSHVLAGEVLRYIKTNSAQRLTERAMAAHFSLTPSAFSRVVSRELGMGFSRLLAELRVARASNLLLHADDDVQEVARLCGFGTVASLNRHFRRVKNTTPTAYRKQARQANAGFRAGEMELVRCDGMRNESTRKRR